jgi:N-6 DNA methylase
MITLLAKLAAARAVSQRRLIDPLEHLAWVESAAPFEEAGIADFLDGIPEDCDRVSGDDVARALALLEDGARPLGHLYMKLVPRSSRHGAGEYYTPAWLVEHVLDRAGFGGEQRLIDPMCGAGAFLVGAIRRMRRAQPELPAAEVARRIHGMDVNPTAVLMARVEYLAALNGCVRGPIRIPVLLGDAILAPAVEDDARFDVVAGNPPWVGWESLSPEYRAATKSLWQHHGLFPDGGAGMRAMLGRGRKDLSMLATCAAADRLLKPAGRLAFVIAQSIFKSVGGGAGFRRFVLGDGTPLKVTGVDDFSATRVFAGSASRAAVIALVKGEPTSYPVAYTVWGRDGSTSESVWAEPVDERDATSAWLTGSRERLDAVRRALGPSSYRARAGAYTGGANGVYWLRPCQPAGRFTNMTGSGKRPTPIVEARIEEALVYPLLRASEVGRFETRSSAFLLLPQDPVRRRGIDPDVMAERYPDALQYLSKFREALAARRDRGTRSLIEAGAPFFTIFSVTTDTMAAWKAVWPRIASRVTAAAVGPREGRPVIPQETCTFIACEADDAESEAHYLAGLLNSSFFNDAAAAFAHRGSKSFGAPHLLRHIAVPRYDPVAPGHRALAVLTREAGASLPQAQLDEAAAEVWQHRSRSPGKPTPHA